jgi:hypothetical protein
MFALIALQLALADTMRPSPGAHQIVALLAQAEREAKSPGKAHHLARTLARLDALGARPLDPTDATTAAWRAQSANATRTTEPGATTPLRGRTLGAAYQIGELQPGSRHELRQSFLAGQRAEVTVKPFGRGRLSLKVSDASGRSFCSSGPAATQLSCAWVPAFSGATFITLISDDREARRYVLVLR